MQTMQNIWYKVWQLTNMSLTLNIQMEKLQSAYRYDGNAVDNWQNTTRSFLMLFQAFRLATGTGCGYILNAQIPWFGVFGVHFYKNMLFNRFYMRQKYWTCSFSLRIKSNFRVFISCWQQKTNFLVQVMQIGFKCI